MNNEEKQSEETPEVYALKQDKSGWQFSRREFLAASGAAAAALTATGCGKITLGPTPTPTASPTPTPTPQPTLNPEEMKAACLTIQAHSGVIYSLAISPDGSLMASGSSDGAVKLWSFPDGQLIKTLETDNGDGIRSLSISPDGTLLAACYRIREGFTIWSLPDGQLLTSVENGYKNNDLLFCPDGSLWVARDLSGLQQWSMPDGELLNELSTGYTDFLAPHPDGTMVIGMTDGYISIWSFPEFELLETIGKDDKGSITSISISPDGTLLAAMGMRSLVRLYSLPEGEYIERLDPHEGGGRFTLFSPDGSLLLVHNGEDPTIHFWSLAEHAYLDTMNINVKNQYSAVFSPDGSMLVLGSAEGEITIWSYPDLQLLGCPMDLMEMEASAEGITYNTTNSAGETVTYTLPCGSPLPAGAVCTCNCVSGSGCSCVGHSSGGGSHYWHPN